MTTTRETADHAELARWLREDADWQRKMKGGTTNDRKLDEAADALETLLSEIAALRGLLDERDLEIAEDDAAMRDLDAQIEDATARATQAERQRDEAVGLLAEVEPLAICWTSHFAHTRGLAPSHHPTHQAVLDRTRTFLANQGADQ